MAEDVSAGRTPCLRALEFVNPYSYVNVTEISVERSIIFMFWFSQCECSKFSFSARENCIGHCKAASRLVYYRDSQ